MRVIDRPPYRKPWEDEDGESLYELEERADGWYYTACQPGKWRGPYSTRALCEIAARTDLDDRCQIDVRPDAQKGEK